MKRSSSAVEAWKQLRNALSTQGPMYPISLMKKALVTHFNPMVDLDQSIIDLNHTMDMMFGAGPIKEDNWKTMVFINTVQHGYFMLIHELLEALLTSAKDTINFQAVQHASDTKPRCSNLLQKPWQLRRCMLCLPKRSNPRQGCAPIQSA